MLTTTRTLARLAFSAARLAALVGLAWASRRAVDVGLALAPWEAVDSVDHRR
jgi:hypothetical protein